MNLLTLLLNELRREASYRLTQRNLQDMKNNIDYRDDHVNNPPQTQREGGKNINKEIKL